MFVSLLLEKRDEHERQLPVRIGKQGFQGRVKGQMHIEFGAEKMTSYAGLELFRRLLSKIGVLRELLVSEKRVALAGDLRFRSAVLAVVAMLLVGARRLRHIEFLRDDPMFLRFAGLKRAPSQRTLSRTLKKLTSRTWPELDRSMLSLIGHADEVMKLRRWTLDVDGTVLTTGLRVERAKRGFNPHHRKNPSYYPILATLAQSGHVVGHMNRRGNIVDAHRSDEFLRDTVCAVREELGFDGLLELRADSAFFRREFLVAADLRGLEYAIKVPMWPCFNLRGVVRRKRQTDWQWIDRDKQVQGLETELHISTWGRTERIAIYRKRVNHEPSKSRQLDLFNPDDGKWEYSVVATNKSLGLRALWHFYNGRGVQEKTIAELKSGFAFSTIPTNRYSANTAWQKLSLLSHNIATTFQLRTSAEAKPRSLKRTTSFLIRSIATLRFEWLNKAARLLRPGDRPVLRLVDNVPTRDAIRQIEQNLDRAA